MGRHRSRSRSSSPRRSKRYDEPRESRSRRDRRSPAPSGLLVRNISLDARQEDLRIPFERFGPIKDIYLPKDYYTGEPRGFGFVKFKYGEDAVAAKEHLNCTVIGGREIRIVFAEENRKTPHEMRRVTRPRGRDNYRRRSPERSPRRRHRSYSRSASPVRSDLRNRRANDDYSPRRSRSISQSRSPNVQRSYGSPQNHRPSHRSPSRSPPRGTDRKLSPSPQRSGSRSRHDERNHSPSQRSPSRSPPRGRTDRKLSPSPSPGRDTHIPARSRSRS